MRKIWIIARKELWETYTDINLLLTMLATPLALATIIGGALGGVAEGSSIQDIPVAIVNQDTGELGDIIVSAYLPDEATVELGGDGQTCEQVDDDDADDGLTNVSLQTLTEATLLDSADDARAAVNRGAYAAAVIIPPDFSDRAGYSQSDPNIEPVDVEVYGDPGSAVTADIISGITANITNQIATGNITIAATIETLIDRAQNNPLFGGQFALLNVTDNFNPNFACAFTPDFNTVQVEQQTVTGALADFDPLVYFGAAQAMFFMLFTAQGSANSILEDQRQGVLQRLLTSPTPRITILLGKLVSTFVLCMTQLILLLIAFTAVGFLFNGELTLIWGTNFGMILLLVIAASLSGAGLGALLAAIAQNAEQANTVGTVINIAMGALGGAFFTTEFIPALQAVQWVSIVYWGKEAFTTLAAGQTDIWLAIGVLLLQGGIMFLLGLWAFNRRLEDI